MQQTISIIIKGKVQGVFFRQSTKEIADELGIKGTVENLPDGSVKIIATGNEKQLSKLSDWSKNGPRRANVTDTIVNELEFKSFENFSVIRN